MNRFRFLIFALSCLQFISKSSWAQPKMEEGFFWHTLRDTSKLMFLQARLGSRHSFSLATAHRSVFQGSVGMDNDNLQFWKCAWMVEGKSYGLATTSGLSPDFIPAKNEEVGMQCLQTAIRGEGGGIQIQWIQSSDWVKALSLEDTSAMKASIAPYYAWNIQVRNTTTKNQKVNLMLGPSSIPIDPDKNINISWWRLGQPTQRLYFRDGSAKSAYAALSAPASLKTRLVERKGSYLMEWEVELAPGETRNCPLVWATFQDQPVLLDEKHNQPLSFAYTRWFSSVDAVSDFGLAQHINAVKHAADFHQLVASSTASPEEKWMATLSFRTDLANGLLVRNPQEKWYWFETEGRFRHMNTLDVAFETQIPAVHMPWRLKLLVDQWASYIALFEEWVPSTRSRSGIKYNLEGVSSSETGAFVYHDHGNFPVVMNAEGYDFGPNLPVEENTGFVFMLYHYFRITSDTQMVRKYAGLVATLLQSLQNRDANGNGLADVGHGWSTYDVSEAIKRAPDNTYSGVKMAAAYLLGSELLKLSVVVPIRSIDQELKTKDQDGTTLNGTQKALWEKGTIGNRYLREKQAAQFEKEAALILKTLQKAQKKHGFMPVSLDEKFPGWNQQATVIAEGLLYPTLWKFRHPVLTGFQKLLLPEWEKARLKCQRSYGLTVSSSEPVTWFSKTMVMDYVARKNFGWSGSHAKYPYLWNQNNDQAYQDGANSPTEPWPGNWYPRGMSSWLYLLP